MAIDIIALAAAQALFYAITPYNFSEQPAINWVELDTKRFWGPTDKFPFILDDKIYPANITFSQSMIADLKTRLNTSINAPRTFTKHLNNVGWQYGFNPNQTLTWMKYWNEQYNFTAQQTFWNQFPMFHTQIQGLDIFYIRVSPPKNTTKQVVPFLLLHGWPGSIREFFDVIPILTADSPDRDFVIDLIVPSLPGFGFSSAAGKPGMGAAHMAVVFRNLMRRIGFRRWYIQGGDFGALINGHMATLFPDEVLGFHTNWGVVLSPVAISLQMVGTLYPPLVVPQKTFSRMYPIETRFQILTAATGYMHIQGTKPGTIGTAMTDSPAALAAYVLEKYATAVDKGNIALGDGGLFKFYKQDFLIDVLMYYWSTHSMETAMRLYSETFNKRHFGLRMEEIATFVPTWVVQAGQEFTYQSPIILGLKYKNMLNVTVLDIGGHFLAAERPQLFSDSVFDALKAFRAWHVQNGTDTNVFL